MSIEKNLKHIKEQISNACIEVGREPSEVELLPVSKTKPESLILEASAQGYKRFGENKIQEAYEKSKLLREHDFKWVMIGHLQTNKAKIAAKFASEIQSLDSLKLAKELDKRLQTEGRALDVLVQVNTSNEEQKFGIAPSELHSFAKELNAYSSLNVKGLMTMAMLSKEEERVRSCFRMLKELQMRLQQGAGANHSWSKLSMGMSGDFKIAIEEGSTEIRIGQAIFGAR